MLIALLSIAKETILMNWKLKDSLSITQYTNFLLEHISVERKSACSKNKPAAALVGPGRDLEGAHGRVRPWMFIPIGLGPWPQRWVVVSMGVGRVEVGHRGGCPQGLPRAVCLATGPALGWSPGRWLPRIMEGWTEWALGER